MSLIAISSINDLQDARYCAAMNVDLIGFSLDQDAPNAISPQKVREIAAWLSGPRIFISCGKDNMQDLKELENTLSFFAVQIKEDDFDFFSIQTEHPIYLYLTHTHKLSHISVLIKKIQAANRESKVIVPVSNIEEAVALMPIFDDILLHFSNLTQTTDFLKDYKTSILGVFLGQEAFIPKEGLNYEQLDVLTIN